MEYKTLRYFSIVLLESQRVAIKINQQNLHDILKNFSTSFFFGIHYIFMLCSRRCCRMFTVRKVIGKLK